MSGLAPSVRNVSHKKPFFTSQSKMDLGNKQGLVLTGSCPRPVDDESMQSVRTQINKNCCNPWIPLQSVEHVASAFKLVSKLRPLEKTSKGSGDSLRLIHHVFARLESCIVFPWVRRPCCSAFGGVSSRGLLRKDTYNPYNLLGSSREQENIRHGIVWGFVSLLPYCSTSKVSPSLNLFTRSP